MSSCEWNPWLNRPDYDGEPVHAEATWNIGNGAWHLCEECAKLNFFDHYRKRTWMGKKPESVGDLPEL